MSRKLLNTDADFVSLKIYLTLSCIKLKNGQPTLRILRCSTLPSIKSPMQVVFRRDSLCLFRFYCYVQDVARNFETQMDISQSLS